MGKELKKGKKGEAAAYVTRAQALKRLQLPLADFRKLCILKGVYPRDPKKKSAGKDKTYFHIKDIRFLLHEPLLDKFMKQKTFMKKYKRLIGRKDRPSAKAYEEKNKPTFTLHHLVKERYPKFEDALRDLDDALCMVALFDTLPVDKRRDIAPDMVSECTRLLCEFQLFLLRERRVRKVFATIKGYYFQAELSGVPVTWLQPHRFTQKLAPEVDFRVMDTFLRFYRTLLKFVNYRLYTQAGLQYPPAIDATLAKMAGKTASLKVEHFEQGPARSVEPAPAIDFAEVEEVKAIHAKDQAEKRRANLFEGLKIFVAREVPFDPLYLCLRACGAEVGWPREGSPFAEDDAGVTHQIVDRPLEAKRPGREYVQPQWVFDCLNEGVKLPIAEYAPGAQCPAHLSPFVDADAEGYAPARRTELSAIAKEAEEAEAEENVDPEDAEAEDPEALAAAELDAELRGVPSSEKVTGVKTVSKATKKKAAAAEEDERLRSMMPKKHKRMLMRIDQREKTKDDRVAKLVSKRKKSQGK